MEKQAQRKTPKRQGHRPQRRVTAARLAARTEELLREELTPDQQHQLLTVKRLLMLEPNDASPEGQAALACAEIVVDTVRLAVFQRRYGLAG